MALPVSGLDQVERLVAAVEAEHSRKAKAPASGNAKLLGHLLDLAFDKIPADPGNPAFRHGGTLAQASRHWFRAKTGNGRYRLFYRLHSKARMIVLAWVNDEIGANDLLIASQAISGGLTLVTDDTDFDRLPELPTENWLH